MLADGVSNKIAAATLAGLYLEWPSGNGVLEKIKLDGDELYKQESMPPTVSASTIHRVPMRSAAAPPPDAPVVAGIDVDEVGEDGEPSSFESPPAVSLVPIWLFTSTVSPRDARCR